MDLHPDFPRRVDRLHRPQYHDPEAASAKHLTLPQYLSQLDPLHAGGGAGPGRRDRDHGPAREIGPVHVDHLEEILNGQPGDPAFPTGSSRRSLKNFIGLTMPPASAATASAWPRHRATPGRYR